MAKRKGLPKKFAKMGFKRGWIEYRKYLRKTSTKKPARKTRKARRNPIMAKRKYYRRAKAGIMNKSFIDGLMSAGGKMIIRKVLGGGAIYEAGVDIGLGVFRHNKTLLAQGIVNGATAFLPSLNLGNGNGGGVR